MPRTHKQTCTHTWTAGLQTSGCPHTHTHRKNLCNIILASKWHKRLEQQIGGKKINKPIIWMRFKGNMETTKQMFQSPKRIKSDRYFFSSFDSVWITHKGLNLNIFTKKNVKSNFKWFYTCQNPSNRKYQINVPSRLCVYCFWNMIAWPGIKNHWGYRH